MAAPDAKTSPSNKEVQQSSESTSEDNAKVAATATATATSSSRTVTVTEPNSSSTAEVTVAALPTYESSEKSEKYVLCKSLLSSGDFEQALELIEQAIEETREILVSMMEHSDTDLHESMAPFHYLYGTTLLYSIEESNDTQMTVAASDEAEGEGAPDGADADEQQNVEDMEIAWENLDTARNIVEAMLLRESDDNITAEFKSKLQLDLAQILLREGDLQRMNGRYAEAILDYEGCLQMRKILLPMYDRKIADAQYNLGLSYLSNSTELRKEENTDPAKIKIAQEHCQKGVQLYVDCAQTLCGQIANLCAVDPSVILLSQDEGTAKVAGFKTTGMDEADVARSNNNKMASQSISAWREAIASLTPVDEDDPRLEDLRQLLQEIQETVDEAERSQEAVLEATQIRIRAQNAADAEDGVTTQIGFGQPTLITHSAATTATAAAPLMVVKKKKRTIETASTTDSNDQNDTKRTKTE